MNKKAWMVVLPQDCGARNVNEFNNALGAQNTAQR
jgi:hypothetical protein